MTDKRGRVAGWSYPGWSYRVNEDGFRIGGFNGVIRARKAVKGRWAWREVYRCEHEHAERHDAVACAEELVGTVLGR